MIAPHLQQATVRQPLSTSKPQRHHRHFSRSQKLQKSAIGSSRQHNREQPPAQTPPPLTGSTSMFSGEIRREPKRANMLTSSSTGPKTFTPSTHSELSLKPRSATTTPSALTSRQPTRLSDCKRVAAASTSRSLSLECHSGSTSSSDSSQPASQAWAERKHADLLATETYGTYWSPLRCANRAQRCVTPMRWTARALGSSSARARVCRRRRPRRASAHGRRAAARRL